MKTTLKMLMALGVAVLLLNGCGGSGGDETPPSSYLPETPVAIGINTTNLAFSNIVNATLDTLYTTNTVTIVGITEAITVKTSKGTLVVNGVDTDVAEFSVNAGDTVAVKVRSSGAYSTEVSVKVEAGGLVDFFAVTTKADTVTPPPATSTPTISLANQSVDDNGGGLATDLSAPTVTDVQANAVYSIVTGTTGLSIDSATGVMTYNYNLTGSATFNITIKVTNTDGGSAQTSFTLSVTDNL